MGIREKLRGIVCARNDSGRVYGRSVTLETAVAIVTLILAGWGLAQFPHLVTPDVTIQNAAAPESTLRLLLLALATGMVALLPSVLYLFQIFKRQEQR
jgi:cytochrome bd ubiquinol oxidase subunit II